MTNAVDKLKPCPFCGVTPMIEAYQNEGITYPFVICTFTGCYVNPRTRTFRFENSAIKAWQRRIEC